MTQRSVRLAVVVIVSLLSLFVLHVREDAPEIAVTSSGVRVRGAS
jgi:hypothetical protein